MFFPAPVRLITILSVINCTESIDWSYLSKSEHTNLLTLYSNIPHLVVMLKTILAKTSIQVEEETRDKLKDIGKKGRVMTISLIDY
jgi:hypothetical protein